MKRLMLACLLFVSPFTSVYAQEVTEEEPFICCENETAALYPNNLAPITNDDGTVDINTDESSGSNIGARDGEITVQRLDSGLKIYSGLLEVEDIARGSDGWTGRILEEVSSQIVYKPDGRPELTCPSQGGGVWFGPCKVEQAS